MENISSVKENVNSLFQNLERFLKSETVVGEPIVVGDVTLVPIISVVFGCGTGEGQGDKKQAAGGGLGAAAKVTPNAIVVIKDDKVTLLPINGKSNLDNLLDMVPGIVSKIKPKKSEKSKTETNNK